MPVVMVNFHIEVLLYGVCDYIFTGNDFLDTSGLTIEKIVAFFGFAGFCGLRSSVLITLFFFFKELKVM